MENGKTKLSLFVKQVRKASRMSQQDLADKAAVGLHFVRDLEQGKRTLRMDKVNDVLALFNYELGPVEKLRNNE
jgi:y4mF family transcriptional regulator